MNTAKILETISAVPTNRRASFLESLRKYKELSWVVGAPNQGLDRLQGDIFKNFPIASLRSDGSAVVTRKHVMVLNNTCDLPAGRSAVVNVALIESLEAYIKFKKNDVPNIEQIKQNQVSNLLYLPTSPFSGGSLVYLDYIFTVPYSIFTSAVTGDSRIASLTQNGFYLLLMKLGYHLMRIESDDVKREGAQEG